MAHPGIANEAVNIYNKNFDPDISGANKEKIVSGARDEDTPWRWMNHFYDPINNVGLGGKYLSAKDWSEDSNRQRDFALGDRSWQRAVDDWKKGHKDLALTELGHTLHLVADMAVPAHTRLDIHPTGDSLEQFVKSNWNSLETIVKKDVSVKNISKLSEGFDGLAKFSNANFYSDDTLDSNRYNEIFISKSSIIQQGKSGDVLLKENRINNDLNKLYLEKETFSWSGTGSKKIINDPVILTSYSSHLIPESISYSAGVIKLFFNEVGKTDPKVKPLATSRQSLTGVLNGASGQIVQGAENIYDQVKKATKIVLGEKISNEETMRNPNTYQIPITNSPPPPNPSPVLQTNSLPVSNGGSSSLGGNSTPPTLLPLSTTSTSPIVTPTSTPDPTPTSTPTATPEIVTPTSTDSTPTSTPETSTTTPDIAPTSTPLTPTSTPAVDTTPPLPPTPDPIFLPIYFTTSSEVNVFGTATTDTVRLSIDIPIDIIYTTSTNQWNFTYEFATSSEKKSLQIFVYDEVGNTSTPASVTLVRDLTTPTIPTLIADDISSPTSTRIRVSVTSTDEFAREIFFDIDYATSSTKPVWQNWISGSVSTTYDFTATPGSTYVFRARASDQFANTSAWSALVSTTLDWDKRVVINEIAWMGTSAQPNNINDEWVELYNNTNEAINLSGWGLYLNGVKLDWNLRNTQILAHDYFLIERTDDDAIIELPADAFITIPSGIVNTGAKLELKDSSSTIVDTVNCQTGGWYAGATADSKYRTMNRINSLVKGSLKSNWRTSDFGAAIGRTYGGGYIYGTPRAPNIGYGLIPNDFWLVYTHLATSSEFTLRKDLSPYVLYSDAVIAVGKKLIIEPGVEIYGQTKNASLIVKGTVEFNGTENDHILVSSRYDRAPGAWRWSGVSATATPAAGDWSRIAIDPGGKVKMTYTDLRYGGALFVLQSGWVYGWKNLSQPIRNIGGELTMQNSSVSDSFVPASNVDEREFSAFVWTENKTTYSASTTIDQSQFARGYIATKNYYNGGYSSGVTTRISNSVFDSFTHSDGPLQSLRSDLVMSNNQFLNNAFSGAYFDMFTVTTDTIWHAGDYHINGIVSVPAGKKLTIEAGANLQMKAYAGFNVSGILNVWGESDNRVSIDCLNGSCYWSIIDLASGGTGNLCHADLVHGNFTGSSGDKSGVVKAVGAQVELKDINILNAYRPYNAIYLKDANAVVKNSRIVWNTDYTTDAKTISGIAIDAGNLLLENTEFDRMDYGLMMVNSPSVTLTNQPDSLFQNMKMGKWFPPAFVFTLPVLGAPMSDSSEESGLDTPTSTMEMIGEEAMATSTDSGSDTTSTPELAPTIEIE
ncbi:MAG TPA: lamin tail domain-containing protein [Candidatus Magasanikbacteria bacterium]|nr:lamin tail domain-containing protein [Candidatus Magasanikbacteria bacterium]